MEEIIQLILDLKQRKQANEDKCGKSVKNADKPKKKSMNNSDKLNKRPMNNEDIPKKEANKQG